MKYDLKYEKPLVQITMTEPEAEAIYLWIRGRDYGTGSAVHNLQTSLYLALQDIEKRSK